MKCHAWHRVLVVSKPRANSPEGNYLHAIAPGASSTRSVFTPWGGDQFLTSRSRPVRDLPHNALYHG
jgi:hypothetical protein